MKPECDKPNEGRRTRRPKPEYSGSTPPTSSAEYVELHAHSQHSLRDSAAHVEDLVERAKALGMRALAITDHDSAAVAPEFRAAALASEIRPIQGVEMSFKGTPDGPFHLTLLAEDDEGFGNLCEILTRARSMRFDTAPVREGSKTPWGKASIPLATPEMLEGKTEHLLCLTGCVKSELSHHLLRREDDLAEQTLARWVDLFGTDNVFVELQDHRLGFEPSLNARKCELARRFGLPMVATNNVHTLVREDFWVHEALACWRAGRQSRRTVFPDRPRSAEVYLKSPAEIAVAFAECPDALRNTLVIAERCRPVLDPSIRRWPQFFPPEGFTEETYLDHLTGIGARARFGDPLTDNIRRRMQYELRLIRDKGFAGYFLQVWDTCRWMRREDILYRVRGSAGGSVVAYCLYVGTINPFEYNLSFDRFLNEARNAPPDIDLDIDSRERDRVVAHVREVFGRERVASVAAYNTVRGKSLIRDFGPVFDLPPEAVEIAAKSLRNVNAHQLGEAFDNLPQLRDAGLTREPFEPIIDLGRRISRFPSHNQTTVGVVIGGIPLARVSPLWPAAKDGEAAVSYDKDWVEKVGLIKTDFLFLRELAAIRDCVKSLRECPANPVPLDYDRIPLDDKATWDLLSSGQTIGVFQLESPAQRVLMQRMKPRHISDCVAAVALIRPGPITGNAVDPFVLRRTGREPVVYPDDRLKPVLEETLGVVIYQDQVIELAIAAAGWSPDRADQLRRRISHARSKDKMRDIQEEFTAAVVENGFTEDVALWCFRSILGFASYGFCHAHAAAFGETAYKSAWLLAHYPAHYLMGVMNNFPMAYYPLRTVVAEARRRGIKVLGPDVNRSSADDRANHSTIRAGLKHVNGIKKRTLEAIEAARAEGPFVSPADFCNRVPASRDEVESLALAGAFDRLHPNRKAILRGAERLTREGTDRRAFPGLNMGASPLPRARDFTPYEKSLRELATLGFCAGSDPMAFHREQLRSVGVQTCAEALSVRPGHRVLVAGWRTRAHTPPIKSGKTIVFFMLEDETALVDVTVFPDIYDIYGRVIFSERMVVVSGTAQDRDGAYCLVAESVRPLRDVLAAAREMEESLPVLSDTSFAECGWEMALPGVRDQVSGVSPDAPIRFVSR